MRDIAIYGAGGFGREVACLIQQINKASDKNKSKWNIVGFFDDNLEKGDRNEYGEVLGGLDELNSWPISLSVVIAIASPKSVKRIAESVTNKKVDWPNIIAPDVTILDRNNLKMGKGNIVCSRCFFSCHVIIGDFNIFNGYVLVGHDNVIGNYNTIMPAVRLSGKLSIGNCNFFGVNSIVLQNLQIGKNTTIGAGSIVFRKTEDGYTYVGNPAKKYEF